MNKREAIEIAREFARQKRRKLGKLLFSHFYDGESLKADGLDPIVLNRLSNHWCVWFFVHADYQPPGTTSGRKKDEGTPKRAGLARAIDAALSREPESEILPDPRYNVESFLIDPATGQVTEHQKPLPKWVRLVSDPINAGFDWLVAAKSDRNFS